MQSTPLSDFTQHLEFEVDAEHFGFVPGQWVSLKQIAPDGEEITRAYSIASPPDGKRFALCLNRVQDGFMSNYLCDLHLGAEISGQGPFGNFILRPPLRDTLFIATGTGIAPYRSMLHWLLADPARLEAMGRASASLARPEAAQRIAEEVLAEVSARGYVAIMDTAGHVLRRLRVGKEVAARLLHNWSGRAGGPFIVVTAARMTPERAERHRRSFAYGNVKIENDSITWEMIESAADCGSDCGSGCGPAALIKRNLQNDQQLHLTFGK